MRGHRLRETTAPVFPRAGQVASCDPARLDLAFPDVTEQHIAAFQEAFAAMTETLREAAEHDLVSGMTRQT